MISLYLAKLAARRAYTRAQNRDAKAWQAYKAAEQTHNLVEPWNELGRSYAVTAKRLAGTAADDAARELAIAFGIMARASDDWCLACERAWRTSQYN